MIDEIKKIIRKYTEFENDISDDSQLDRDLYIDSMSILFIMEEIEKKFEIKIDLADFIDNNTPRLIEKMILDKK